MMTELIGQTLGQYEIIEQIGAGGMATVYKAYQSSLRRYVAIKVLPPLLADQPGFSERFHREARAIASLNHPNILPVHNFGEQGKYNYLVMRYIDGARTLRDVMAAPLTLAQVARWVEQIAAALDYAHERGIVHRDVKPANVLIEGDWAWLTDFGLARMAEESVRLTGTGVGVGTPAYMSPEQGQGLPVDRRSDIYALGTILYEMVTGRLPYEAETPVAIVFKRALQPLPSPRQLNPALPLAVEQVIVQALALKPEDRFATAGEMAAAFNEAIRTAGAEEVSTGPGGAVEEFTALSPAGAQRQPAPEPPPPAFLASPRPAAAPPAPSPPTVVSPAPPRPTFPKRWLIGLGGVAALGAGLIVGVLLIKLNSFLTITATPQPPTWIPVSSSPAANLADVTPSPTHPPTANSAGITPGTARTPLPASFGGHIAFVSYRDGNAEIYVINPNLGDSGPVIRQTYRSQSDWYPTWSPDGHHLAFTSNHDHSQEIYVLSVTTEPQAIPDHPVIQLTDYPAQNDNLPAWSPDGRRIAFTSYREGSEDIYILEVQALLEGASSGRLTRLTSDPGDDLDPTWSPDGSQLAFTHVDDTNQNGYIDPNDLGEIYRVNADGSGMTRLTDNLAQDGGPAWSPDGTQIAFWSNRNANAEIYVMNVDGSKQINLSNHSASDTYPTWSPAGRWIAFVSERDGNREIYVMNAECGSLAAGCGSGQTNLTNNPANDTDPAWGP